MKKSITSFVKSIIGEVTHMHCIVPAAYQDVDFTKDVVRESEVKHMGDYEISVQDCPQALQDEIQHLTRKCKLLCVNRFIYDDNTVSYKAYMEDCYGVLILLHYSTKGEIFKCIITSIDLQTFYWHSKGFKDAIVK